MEAKTKKEEQGKKPKDRIVGDVLPTDSEAKTPIDMDADDYHLAMASPTYAVICNV